MINQLALLQVHFIPELALKRLKQPTRKTPASGLVRYTLIVLVRELKVSKKQEDNLLTVERVLLIKGKLQRASL